MFLKDLVQLRRNNIWGEFFVTGKLFVKLRFRGWSDCNYCDTGWCW